MLYSTHSKNLVRLEGKKSRTVKKAQKYSNAIIFFVLLFTEKQKKWNSDFAIVDIPCNFQRNRPKEMAIGFNGLTQNQTLHQLSRCGVINILNILTNPENV